MDGQVGYDYTFRRPTELDATGANKGLQYAFLRVRANSIEGGTSEILRNILGEQVLGLPASRRVDKELPWAQVPRQPRNRRSDTIGGRPGRPSRSVAHSPSVDRNAATNASGRSRAGLSAARSMTCSAQP